MYFIPYAMQKLFPFFFYLSSNHKNVDTSLFLLSSYMNRTAYSLPSDMLYRSTQYAYSGDEIIAEADATAMLERRDHSFVMSHQKWRTVWTELQRGWPYYLNYIFFSEDWWFQIIAKPC